MKTKYDWSVVPKEVNWIATDEDGGVFGYTYKKTPINDGFMWYGRVPIKLDLNPYQGNWQDSLRKRPQ